MIAEIVICYLVIVAVFHFVYDGIVLPSIRQHFRNKLFILRDELRSIYIDEKDTIDREIFNLVHDSLSNFINRIHILTISTRKDFVKRYSGDKGFKKEIDKRRTMVEKYDHQKLKNIIKEADQILKYSFIANSGAWFVYVIPIAFVVWSMKKISDTAKEIFVIPGNEADQLMPVTT